MTPILYNKDTVEAEMIFVELFKTVDEEENPLFLAQLLFILDSEKGLFFNIPLDIQASSKEEILRYVIRGTLSLFASIGSIIPITDLSSGKVVEKIDLSTLYPKESEGSNSNFFVQDENKTIH